MLVEGEVLDTSVQEIPGSNLIQDTAIFTYSMEYSPWEASWLSASQETPGI